MIASKKLRHRVAEVLRPLGLGSAQVGGVMDHVDAQAPDLGADAQARVNTVLPLVLAAIAAPALGMTAIDGAGLIPALAVLINKIGRGDRFDDVIITVAFGAAETAPSIRLPAYLVPALRSLRALRDLAAAGKIVGSPRVRIYKCDGIGILANRLDPARVRRVSALTFRFVHAFVAEFFHDLADGLDLEADDGLDPASGFAGPVASAIHRLADSMDDTPTLADEWATIQAMARKYAGPGGSGNGVDLGRFYANAHPVYDGSIDLANARPFPCSGARERSLVLVHSGRAQSVFVPVSRALMEAAHLPAGSRVHPTLHLLIKAGRRPVYYPARDGDLLIDQDASRFDFATLDRAVQGDLDILLTAVAEPRYRAFLDRFRQAEAAAPTSIPNPQPDRI